MLVKRVCWIVSTTLCLGVFLACGGQVPSEAQRDVEKTAAGSVKELTAKELNELVLAKNQKGAKLPFGAIYEVHGEIKSITIQAKSEKLAEQYQLGVLVKDYAAVTVVCRFAAEHKQLLAAHKIGDSIKVRGKLSDEFNLFQDSIFLNGCIIQP